MFCLHQNDNYSVYIKVITVLFNEHSTRMLQKNALSVK